MISQTEPMNQGVEPPKIQVLDYNTLHASATNPRQHFDEAALQELSENIEEHGIRMPLLARPSKLHSGGYEIVAGERRYRATGKALERLAEAENPQRYGALFKLPVIVEDLDDATVLELQLIENLQRQDLTPLEEARGYQRLLDLEGGEYTPEKIAHKIGKKIDTILNKLKMLKAPKILQTALEEGKVSERHLVLVATVPGDKAREECAKKVLKGTWDWQAQEDKPLSVRETLSVISDNYRMSLRQVMWSLDDETLVEAAGACSRCPHFAKYAAQQDAELAGSLGNGRGQTDPLTCMNPECWKKKQEATLKVIKAAQKEGGPQVMKPAEQEKIINERGDLLPGAKVVKLDDKLGYEILGHYNDDKAPTWREVIGTELAGAEVKVASTKGAGLVELVDKKAAIEAAKKHGKHKKIFDRVTEGGKKIKTEQELKQREKELFRQKVDQRARFVLFTHLGETALEKGVGREFLMALLDVSLREAGMDGCRFMAEWLKLEVHAPKKDTLSQAHYREAVIEHITARDSTLAELQVFSALATLAKWVKVAGIHTELVNPFEKLYGFDEKTIEALATSQIQSEMAQKEAKKKPKLKSKGRDTDAPGSTLEVNAQVATAEILKQGDKERKRAPSRKRGTVPPAPAPMMSVQELAGELGLNEPEQHQEAGEPMTWTLEQKAAALHAGTHDLATLIGQKPNRKDKEALKVWDAERYRVRAAAAKLR